jgi:prenylcysteine alpha-carboxyl methylesterase
MQLASEHPACGRASAEGEAFVPRSGAQGLHRRTGAVPLNYSSPRSGHAGDGKRTTFREDVGHAAAETYLVTGLAFTLLGYLG